MTGHAPESHKRPARALVLGASGIVGGGILKSFLDAGYHCIAPARRQDSVPRVLAEATAGGSDADAAALLEAGRLEAPAMDYSTEPGARQLAEYIVQWHGAVQHIVAAAGGMVPMGRLTQLSQQQIVAALHDRVLSQCLLAAALLPVLEESPASSYTIVTGKLGERCTMPDGALFTVASAAVYGVRAALQAEYVGRPQRIIELRIGGVVRRDRQPCHPDLPDLAAFPASCVGAAALRIAASADLREEVVRLEPDAS